MQRLCCMTMTGHVLLIEPAQEHHELQYTCLSPLMHAFQLPTNQANAVRSSATGVWDSVHKLLC